MTVEGAQGGEEEAWTLYRHVGGQVSDVEPTGLANPVGFVKDNEELNGVRVLLRVVAGVARRLKCGACRREKQVFREGRNERLNFVMCFRVLGGHQGCVGVHHQRSSPRSCESGGGDSPWGAGSLWVTVKRPWILNELPLAVGQ